MPNAPLLRRSLFGLSVVGLLAIVSGQHHVLPWLVGLTGTAEPGDLPLPAAGNPSGDVTIVAYLDYNCPICKQTAGDLRRFVEGDGGIRLVYRDWPVLGRPSIHGAKLALAAMYQGHYETAHRALMALRGGRVTEARMDAAVEAGGVDMERLRRDLAVHGDEISRILARNTVEAARLGLSGTPAYLIDRVRAHSLDRAGFLLIVDDVRRRRREQPAPGATPAPPETPRPGGKPPRGG